jgi:hypothetical protein
LTTYTTTTVCPVTETHGTQVVTTLTTSTATITSCKGGCGYETTAVPPKPTSSKPADHTTVVTTYEWVPCSTEVGHSGTAKIYSTYLTASYKTYTSTAYGQPPKPTGEAPKPSGDKPGQPKTTVTVGVDVPQSTPVASKDNKPSQPAGKTVTVGVDVPQYTPGPGQENCPAPVTVTKTVTVGVDVPQYTPVPNDHTTKVVTATEGGKPQTYTVTIPAGPKSTPSGEKTYQPKTTVSVGVPQSTQGPKPSASKGHSVPAYSSSVPAPYPTSTPSSSSAYVASTPAASSSVGYPVASSSVPAYPVASSSSTKATPVPTGGYNTGYSAGY